MNNYFKSLCGYPIKQEPQNHLPPSQIFEQYVPSSQAPHPLDFPLDPILASNLNGHPTTATPESKDSAYDGFTLPKFAFDSPSDTSPNGYSPPSALSDTPHSADRALIPNDSWPIRKLNLRNPYLVQGLGFREQPNGLYATGYVTQEVDMYSGKLGSIQPSAPVLFPANFDFTAVVPLYYGVPINSSVGIPIDYTTSSAIPSNQPTGPTRTGRSTCKEVRDGKAVPRKTTKNRLVPDDQCKMITVQCRVNDCNVHCIGKEEFLKHLAIAHDLVAKHNNNYPCLSSSPIPCQHVASGRDPLINHMRAVHGQVIAKDNIPEQTGKVLCPWSGCKDRLKLSSLQRHVAAHVKVTFRCPICPHKRCSRLSDYQRHFKVEHKEEFAAGEYRYEEATF